MIIGKRDRSANKYQDLKDQHFSLASHPGVIPSALWLACQYKLDENHQLGNAGRGKHTWLSGLMKCASCGYSVKVTRDREKFYLFCSGRSNLGLCSQSIHVDLRGLESSVAAELERLLAQCPDAAVQSGEGQELAQELAAIDQKIDRLMSALAESSDMAMPYVNRTISRLEGQRQALLDEQTKRQAKPRPKLEHLKFEPLGFEQKKLVAAQFIEEIRLADDTASVLWKV